MTETGRAASIRRTGALIVNADDWGRDRRTTDATLACTTAGAVSSVSAMVFMMDSERAARIAREQRIDVGLHLNFTEPFAAAACPAGLAARQMRLSRCLRGHRLAQILFHPRLAQSFHYVVAAQLDEFCRLYGRYPDRIDGHHHMHLCANVLLGRLLPAGTLVRRSCSFGPGEKSVCNRAYRSVVDRLLARRHPLVDHLFALAPVDPRRRVRQLFARAERAVVEIEAHPVNLEEYRFLAGGDIFREASGRPIVTHASIRHASAH